ncbi:hypothetical protein Tco_0206427 [Tanacetum coccineum]
MHDQIHKRDTCNCSVLDSRKLKIKGRVLLHLRSSADDSNGTQHYSEKEPYVEKVVVELYAPNDIQGEAPPQRLTSQARLSEVSSIEKEKPQMKKIKNIGQEKKVISAYCSNTQRGDQQRLKSGAVRGIAATKAAEIGLAKRTEIRWVWDKRSTNLSVEGYASDLAEHPAGEPWLLHKFEDFYGEELHRLVVGYIQPARGTRTCTHDSY